MYVRIYECTHLGYVPTYVRIIPIYKCMYVRTCSDIVFILGSLDPCTVFLEESVLWVVVALWTALA